MKKIHLMLCFLAISFLFVFSGCSSKDLGSGGSVYGNTAANLQNLGFMVEGSNGEVYSFNGTLGEIDLIRIENNHAETLIHLPGKIKDVRNLNYWDQTLYMTVEDTTDTKIYRYDLKKDALEALRTGNFINLAIYDGNVITVEYTDEYEDARAYLYNLDMTERALLSSNHVDSIFIDNNILYALAINDKQGLIYGYNLLNQNTIYRFDCKKDFEKIDPIEIGQILDQAGIHELAVYPGLTYGDYFFCFGTKYPNSIKPDTMLVLNLENQNIDVLGDLPFFIALNVYNEDLFSYGCSSEEDFYDGEFNFYRIKVSDKIDDIQTIFVDNRDQRIACDNCNYAYGNCITLSTTNQGLFLNITFLESPASNDGESNSSEGFLSTYEISRFDPNTEELVVTENTSGVSRLN